MKGKKKVEPKEEKVPAKSQQQSQPLAQVAQAAAAAAEPQTKKSKNKQRTLVSSTRGITSAHRHLMKDWRRLLPHHKKEPKLDSKDHLPILNEITEMKDCNNCLFFESRKKKDLFLWLGKTPNGPSIKFHVVNVYSMEEMKLTGNALHGSRPLLFFDQSFDSQEHLRLVKEIAIQALGTPKGHHKSKPFIDHVYSFSVLDDKIWFRNYQILEKEVAGKKDKETTLVEIGPRMVLNIVRVFSGSFGGPTLYENPNYVSPNLLRAIAYKKKAAKYVNRVSQIKDRERRQKQQTLPKDPFADVFK